MAQTVTLLVFFFLGGGGGRRVFLSQTGPCGILGRQSGNGSFFSEYIGFYPCQYHFDNAPYSLNHLYPLLRNPGSCRSRNITHLRISKQVQ